jgi:hypothetical protein
VLHLLSCLAADGRLGLTAIAGTPHQAGTLSAAAVTVLDDLAAATKPG